MLRYEGERCPPPKEDEADATGGSDDDEVEVVDVLPSMREDKPPGCHQHNNMEIRYVCGQDGSLLCGDCLVSTHQCHPAKLIDEEVLRGEAAGREASVSNANKLLEDLQNVMESCVGQKMEAEKRFQEKKEARLKELREKEDAALTVLEEKIKTIQTRIDWVKQREGELMKLVRFSRSDHPVKLLWIKREIEALLQHHPGPLEGKENNSISP